MGVRDEHAGERLADLLDSARRPRPPETVSVPSTTTTPSSALDHVGVHRYRSGRARERWICSCHDPDDVEHRPRPDKTAPGGAYGRVRPPRPAERAQPDLRLAARPGAVSEKWTALVVFALVGGPKRHAELLRMIEGVSQKMLTQTLRWMAVDRLVERRVFDADPPQHVEYRLTALGEALVRAARRALRLGDGTCRRATDGRVPRIGRGGHGKRFRPGLALLRGAWRSPPAPAVGRGSSSHCVASRRVSRTSSSTCAARSA